jgi:hypothetical protein
LLITKQSADTAGRQLELSERPWVYASGIQKRTQLTFDEKTGRGDITIAAELKNSGQSVALNVEFQAFVVAEGSAGIKQQEETLCGPLRLTPDQSFNAAIFPGQPPIVRGEVTGISPEEVAKEKMFWKRLDPNLHLIAPLLIACIDYHFPFSKEHHQTRYAYILGIPQPDGSTWRGFEPKGTPLGIQLIPAGEYAD